MLEDVEFDPVKVFEHINNNAAIRAGDKELHLNLIKPKQYLLCVAAMSHG